MIHPDMTQTKLYRNADFTAAEDLQASLLPEDVAEAVRTVLAARDGMVIPESSRCAHNCTVFQKNDECFCEAK